MKTIQLVNLFNSGKSIINNPKGDVDFKLIVFDNCKLIESECLRIIGMSETINKELDAYNKEFEDVISRYGTISPQGYEYPLKTNEKGESNPKYDLYINEITILKGKYSELFKTHTKNIDDLKTLLDTEVTKKYKFTTVLKKDFPSDATGPEFTSFKEWEILKTV